MRTDSAHTLGIIIVTLNSERFIRACAQSVRDQRTSYPVTCVVIDNNSTDKTISLLTETYPAARTIQNRENVGFSAANNIGIRSVEADTILLLNPDTIVHEGALQELADALWKDDTLAAVGPAILNGDGTPQRTGIAFPSLWNLACECFFLDSLFPRSRIFGRHRRLYEDFGSEFDVDYLQGSCLMMKRSVAEQAGLLDERYFMYFEETDLCRRFHGLGRRVRYIPAAIITHFGGGGAAYYDEFRLMQFTRSYILYLGKHVPAFRRAGFTILLMIRSLVRVAVFSLGSIFFASRRVEFRGRLSAYARTIPIILSGSAPA